MKANRYFLHGDADPDKIDIYYCVACDIFAKEDHFQHHGSENWRYLERSIKKLQSSELAHRPENAHNLAEKWKHNGSIKLFELLRIRYTRIPLTKRKRFEILKRDSYRCQICGKTAKDGARLEVDHKVAVANGGTNDDSNLWTLCFDCNSGKRAGKL
ncbi:HNH endonuclease [Thermomonas sp.]|uniref:HNH endonuclease n=1 Tax=Thermomonas sp. TaxID=1971895 RepID=UPI00391C5833